MVHDDGSNAKGKLELCLVRCKTCSPGSLESLTTRPPVCARQSVLQEGRSHNTNLATPKTVVQPTHVPPVRLLKKQSSKGSEIPESQQIQAGRATSTSPPPLWVQPRKVCKSTSRQATTHTLIGVPHLPARCPAERHAGQTTCAPKQCLGSLQREAQGQFKSESSEKCEDAA